jgi:hypothetical protein
LRPEGSPVGAGVQLSASRRSDRLAIGRAVEVKPTDAEGRFRMVGDAGLWLLEIEPPADSGLPRRRVQVTLPTGTTTAALPDLRFPAVVEVVGTVRAAQSGLPIGRAKVEYFAASPDGTRAVSLGATLSDEQGRYRLVLSDVEDPSAGQ